jgi:hypothetical protein
VSAALTVPAGPPIRLGIHPALEADAPEVIYVWRTLLRIAGHPLAPVWAGGTAGPARVDVYYGPPDDAVTAPIVVPWCGWSLREATARQLDRVALAGPAALPSLRFAGQADTPPGFGDAGDLVFGSFWLLTGAWEPGCPRSRMDDLILAGTAMERDRVPALAPVSRYGARLRRALEEQGRPGLVLPWVAGSGGPTSGFVFTHDVDYPEMLRGIETLRLLARRGFRAWPSIRGIWDGTSHFWQFGAWVAFEREMGARPTFYFMARRGSLLRYALGTPDAFYDISAPRFRRLFAELCDAGCEIGLHASYHAYRSSARLRAERERLAGLSGGEVAGNRHHYWHVDPAAPHETLRRHEEAGLLYDSSLGLEYYPGWRRGICHPFSPWDPGQRREIGVVQLPPAWMDDHFGRRRTRNGVTDPTACAGGLLAAARECGGIVVVDYHARGMNADLYPEYGRWLMQFVTSHVHPEECRRTGEEVARTWLAYVSTLERASPARPLRPA